MIRSALVAALLAACGGRSTSARTPSNTQPATAEPGLPGEVTTFIDRWGQCWHFAGEEPYDDARRKEIEDAEAKVCPGNDQERARLQAKYRDRPDVQDALKKLDEMQ